MNKIFINNSKARKQIEYKIDNNGCWICVSHSKNTHGYPTIYINNKSTGIHRYMYKKFKGEIPEGLCACHKCDNPACINPEHLFIGTYKDNAQDKISKGRDFFPDNTGLHYNKGNKNGRVKLREEQVIKIRNSNLKQRELAEIYKVSQVLISHIQINKIWKHITNEF